MKKTLKLFYRFLHQDIENITEAYTVFQGNAAEAVKLFPANANIAATLSPAGIGPEKTLVKIGN